MNQKKTSASSMTALEKKWEKEKKPVLEDAFDEKGNFQPDRVESSVLNRIPTPTGWRIVLLPYRGVEKSKGGIVLAEETRQKTQLATVCGYVLKVGLLAYKDESKFPMGAWCKEKDWVIFGRYAGSRINIDGGEIRILNDDEILGVISSPEDILHM
jgi:co-chaperonin GroES (HSP10)